MLGQLSQYLPDVVKQVLAVTQNKVMSLGGSVSGSLQAESAKGCAWRAFRRLRSVSGKLPFLHACRRTALSFSQLSDSESCLRCHAWTVQFAVVVAWEADDSAADRDSSIAVACASSRRCFALIGRPCGASKVICSNLIAFWLYSEKALRNMTAVFKQEPSAWRC